VGISRGSRTAPIFGDPILSQERVKLRTLNFVHTFINQTQQKAMKKIGKSTLKYRRGYSQGVSKIFRAPIYGRIARSSLR